MGMNATAAVKVERITLTRQTFTNCLPLVASKEEK